MTEKNKTVLLVSAGIISGCLLTMSVCAIRKVPLRSGTARVYPIVMPLIL